MTTDASAGTGDKVAAWLLYGLQLVFEFLLLLMTAFSVMATDPCGTGVDEPQVCEGFYFGAIFYGFLLLLLVTAIVVPVLIVTAGHRGGRRWVRPTLAIVLLAVATVVYFVLLSQ